ncbi:MAG: hypothetical protein AAFN78_20120, partial [Pseudomonadota bacterium]
VQGFGEHGFAPLQAFTDKFKALHGQMEQLSNAQALDELGYAVTMHSLSESAMRNWLEYRPAAPDVAFADVATSIADWLADGGTEPPDALAQRLWHGSPAVQPFPLRSVR